MLIRMRDGAALAVASPRRARRFVRSIQRVSTSRDRRLLRAENPYGMLRAQREREDNPIPPVAVDVVCRHVTRRTQTARPAAHRS